MRRSKKKLTLMTDKIQEKRVYLDVFKSLREKLLKNLEIKTKDDLRNNRIRLIPIENDRQSSTNPNRPRKSDILVKNMKTLVITKSDLDSDNSQMKYKYTHPLSIVERIVRLEKRVFGNIRHWERLRCDAPNCNKKVEFQCGMRPSDKKIGSWCGERHFKKYAF